MSKQSFICPHCHKSCSENDITCSHCGRIVRNPLTIQPERKISGVILLMLLLAVVLIVGFALVILNNKH